MCGYYFVFFASDGKKTPLTLKKKIFFGKNGRWENSNYTVIIHHMKRARLEDSEFGRQDKAGIKQNAHTLKDIHLSKAGILCFFLEEFIICLTTVGLANWSDY